MSISNGRYSHADVKGHVFVPKKGGLPSEVSVYDIQYALLEPTPEQRARNPHVQPMKFKFVMFTYMWDGQVMSASLKWHKFLTDYVRLDWLEYWNTTGSKPKGV